MTPDELRARILANPVESVEADLLRRLDQLPEVQSASSTWFHGWVEIRVQLAEWTWDAQAEPSALIDAWAREHVANFSVTTRFVPPPLAEEAS